MTGNRQEETDVALLDNMLFQAAIYHTSEDYKELLEFVGRMRNFAPFNAMLLQIQKPGLRFAASEADWQERFNRRVKPGSRPLLILWPFCPVAFVYDVENTDGEKLPKDVASAFKANGNMDNDKLSKLFTSLERKNITVYHQDFGDSYAGNISRGIDGQDKKGSLILRYQVSLNQNHTSVVQFSTLVHELGHLYLGHLGGNKKLKIPDRANLSHKQQEVEAESVAYLTCKRNGIEVESEKYLSNFVGGKELPSIHVYQIMRSVGQIEQLLDLGYKTKFDNVHERVTLQNTNKDFSKADVNIQMIQAVAKIGVFSLLEGNVKFIAWVCNIQEKARSLDINEEDFKPFLKSAYGAISYNPLGYGVSMEIAEKMDLPYVVSSIVIDQII